MSECFAIFDKWSKCWHCDIAGNVAWWPTRAAAEAQIESYCDRAVRLHGGSPDEATSGWFNHAEVRELKPLTKEEPTKKPAAT